MTILKEKLLALLIETGRLPAGSSIDIIAISGEQYSDFCRIEITATKKRCRKPFMCWNICIDTARDLIHWDTSTFYYL